MIRVYDGPGPDAQLVYEGPEDEPFSVEVPPGQQPLFMESDFRDPGRHQLTGERPPPAEAVPETPHEELLKRVADRLDDDADYWNYVDWEADVFDGSFDRVVRAVLAEVRPDMLPPD